MQRIINTLLRYRNAAFFMLLLALSIVFLNQRSYYHNTRINSLGLFLSGSFHSVKSGITEYFHLKEINEKLLEENERLKAIQLMDYQGAIAREESIENEFSFKVKKARVIKNSYNQARNFLIINKGFKDGIRSEMGVIDDYGVIGIVNQVTDYYASVISLLHADIRVNARFKKNGYFGSLYWEGGNPNRMKLGDIVTTVSDVQIGDTIVTGGMSAYFPLGIPIGTITKIDTPNAKGYYDLDVTLFEDFTTLNYVYVIENLDSQELNQLIETSQR